TVSLRWPSTSRGVITGVCAPPAQMFVVDSYKAGTRVNNDRRGDRPMTELRWGILSTAAIGRKKVIPAIQRAERCAVVAIASRDPARAHEVAEELGIGRVHGSYEALLADPDV